MTRALRDRPTTLERWPGGVVPGARLSTREGFRARPSTRSACPRVRPTGCGRRGSHSRPGAPRTRSARTHRRPSCGPLQLGTITFHPWPVRSGDVEHPDELRIDLDPQPGTDFDDAVAVATGARAGCCRVGLVGYPRPPGVAGSVRRGSNPRGRSRRCGMRPSPSAGSSSGGCRGGSPPSGGRRSAARRCSSTTTRTPAIGRSAQRGRCGPSPRRRCPRRSPGRELPDVAPLDFTLCTVPPRLAPTATRTRRSTTSPMTSRPALEWYDRDVRDEGWRTCRIRRTTRRCPASRSGSSRAGRRRWRADEPEPIRARAGPRRSQRARGPAVPRRPPIRASVADQGVASGSGSRSASESRRSTTRCWSGSARAVPLLAQSRPAGLARSVRASVDAKCA